jgi:hypothetical protein
MVIIMLLFYSLHYMDYSLLTLYGLFITYIIWIIHYLHYMDYSLLTLYGLYGYKYSSKDQYLY